MSGGQKTPFLHTFRIEVIPYVHRCTCENAYGLLQVEFLPNFLFLSFRSLLRFVPIH
jgi:hypothetical protein